MNQKQINALPWSEGNRFQLLINGELFFPTMLEAIDNAREAIYVEQYLVTPGKVLSRFIDAWVRAAHRGVRVCILLDDFGAQTMASGDSSRLVAAGVQLCFFNPLKYHKWRNNLFRDHRKILLVDNCVAFVGGAGIADEFDEGACANSWRDTVVKIEGPVVMDWFTVFLQTWQVWGSGELPELTTPPCVAGKQSGRVVPGVPGDVRQIKRSLLRRIESSQSCLWLATAYFIPPRKVRKQIKHAAKRGVDVRLLLPGKKTDHPAIRDAGRRYYARLLASGVRIFEYQPRFSHSKVVLSDGWVSIGSSNVDRWNFRWNLEANQEVDDKHFSQQVRQMFLQDFAKSKECCLADWKNRPLMQKIREWFWGRVDLLVDRYAYRKSLMLVKRKDSTTGHPKY